MILQASLLWTVLLLSTLALAPGLSAATPDERAPSPNNQVRPPDARSPDTEPHDRGPARFPDELRTIDGTGNNGAHPAWGAAGTPLLRRLPSAYSDDVESPAGPDRPSAREISNVVAAQAEPLPDPDRFTSLVWQWGQFLDHDLDLTPAADPEEPLDVPVPAGDAWFDPGNTGTAAISVDRSAWDEVAGVRQQINGITSFIDASNVYGSDPERARALRTLDGSGRLKTGPGNLLPFNTEGLANAPASSPNFFLAGDFRANEQVGLMAMHTLFVREHNRWTRFFRNRDPAASGDELYESARAMVAAQMQAITYREFLPRLLGRDALGRYEGYRPEVNPGISNAFATAAYRFGHTMLPDTLWRRGRDGLPVAQGDLPLAQAFFRPDVLQATGVDPILRGLVLQQAQPIDARVVDAVRNFLFGEPGSGGFDLASLNIQRGRDHGLPSFNEAREALGLSPLRRFRAFDPQRPEVGDRLAAAYATVDDVDLWVGGLSERKAPGSKLGRTFHAILVDQFRRLRDGDRFWYRSYLPNDLVERVEAVTLTEILRRNSGLGDEIPDDPWRRPSPPPGDVSPPSPGGGGPGA